MTVLNWDGTDLPGELRELPAGRYTIERIDDAAPLTAEEEAGLAAALASVQRGEAFTAQQVADRIQSRLKR